MVVRFGVVLVGIQVHAVHGPSWVNFCLIKIGKNWFWHLKTRDLVFLEDYPGKRKSTLYITDESIEDPYDFCPNTTACEETRRCRSMDTLFCQVNKNLGCHVFFLELLPRHSTPKLAHSSLLYTMSAIYVPHVWVVAFCGSARLFLCSLDTLHNFQLVVAAGGDGGFSHSFLTSAHLVDKI